MSGENAHVRKLTLIGVLAGVVLSGCSGSIRPDVPSVPKPSFARFLPHGYRVVKTYRADLSGGVVPNVIVTSANREGTGADLQVLSWNRATRRWWLSFDGRSAKPPEARLGPQEYSNSPAGYPFGQPRGKPSPTLGMLGTLSHGGSSVSIDKVAFGRLLRGTHPQMVFSAVYVSSGGFQVALFVVSFHDTRGKSIYYWVGQTGLDAWHIRNQVIYADANYLATGDALCCAARAYRFALAARGGRIVEIHDDRPFLGVVLGDNPDCKLVDRIWRFCSLVVVRTASNGPASGLLHPGDAILRLENAPPDPYPTGNDAVPYTLFDQVSRLHAGQTARLLIQRGHKRLTVSVKLGSLMDQAASAIRIPTTNGSESVL
jgi:hypothetical protein